MNKNITVILLAAALTLETGCAHAGTVIYDGYAAPVCTVCDGTKVIVHAYGTTVCTHCDGTGVEPPPEVVETVVVNSWCPPPRLHCHPRPIIRPHRPPPPRHHARHPQPARPKGGVRPPPRGGAPRGARTPPPRGGRGHGGGRGRK